MKQSKKDAGPPKTPQEPLSDYRRKVLWEIHLPTGDLSLETLSAKRAIKYLADEGYIKEWEGAGVESRVLTRKGKDTLGIAVTKAEMKAVDDLRKKPKTKQKVKSEPALPEGAIEVNSKEGIPLGYLVPEPDDHFGTLYNVFVYNRDKKAEPAGISTKLEFGTTKVLGTYNKRNLTSYNKAPVGHKKNLSDSQVNLVST